MADCEIVFDMRCLQDPSYKDRGVGKLSANLVRHVGCFRSKIETLTLGLVDPGLPPLEDRFRRLVDQVQSNAYLGVKERSTVFVELSPMTHDPLFPGRIVNDPDILKLAVVYDFIPLMKPERYLPTASSRLDYHTQLVWLSRYDHFFPISQHTSDELRRILNVNPRHITNTGAPIGSAFERIDTSKQPARLSEHYVLVCGGAEPRKNVECPILAHARSRELQDAGVQLVVTGNYPPGWQAGLRDLYRGNGGKAELLIFPGFVDEDELVSIYRGARCVVVAAEMEGFSMPVVEAMAAGSPVIASSIPAHKELVGREDLMFPPGDVENVGRKVEAFVRDPGKRAEIIRDQSTRWQRYRADKIAGEFWAKVSDLVAHRRPKHSGVLRGTRPRIAFLSPMPPDQSGVADYSAATIKELGKLADVHVFSKHPPVATPEGAASARQITALPCLSSGFDRVIGVIGNSHFHLEVFHLLERYGGACIEHDNRLLGFYRILMGSARARALAERELGRPVMEEEIGSWLQDESRLKATFLGEVAEWASPMFVHSRVTAQIVQERFSKAAIYLPFSIYRQWQIDPTDRGLKLAARTRLGIDQQEFAVISLGLVHSNKAVEECIWAVDLLRSWKIPAKLYFIGGFADDECRFRNLVSYLDLADHVSFSSGFVGEAQYRDYLLAADAAVQLRTHFFGGLSGALLDCIAVGLPTVTNEDLAMAMEGPPYLSSVPDHPSPVLVAESLAEISRKGADRSQFDEARRDYSEVHSFENYARKLYEGLGFEIGTGHRSP
ncbi:glycosyltransferase [Mesorhizobium sp. MSK_1335]|uniref:Glycosyltransferase n=1 Tax=Mesorhizobium montanum TaxID=3072323 RepID=A0ABU4ZGI2_9HYPH|nr:glycosyltransferase [Mesorhizobium sp. MSK_1335]MDX8524477.1 glycosyltransferase [Mesorhizobium sp. MSK_1335]